MNRRDWLKLAGGSVAAAVSPHADAAPVAAKKAGGRRKNLLFLFTDQQRRDTLGAYGNRPIKTPNLDALAERSFVFENFYCTQPICTPARGSLLTGLWPHTHGELTNNVPLDPSIPVLPQMLREGEYRTAYFGKWHLGNEIFRQRGFDEFESTEDTYDKFYSKGGANFVDDGRTHSGYYRFLVEHGQKPGADGEFSRGESNALPEELSKPAYLAQIATKFLSEKQDKPWVMYVNFLDPHSPFGSAFNAMYDPKSVPVPESFNDPAKATDLSRTEVIRQGLEKRPNELSTEAVLRREEAHYWGKVSLVDKMVGRILAKLKEIGADEDTVIVYTTDHGEMMGDHHLMYKSVMFEEATRIPMLLRIPGAQGRRLEQPVSGIDVVPTLLDLLGEHLPPHLQGDSWAPYLSCGKALPERDVVIEWNGPPYPLKREHNEPLRTLRTNDGWKLTLVSGSAEGELFDLKTDPRERRNLFYEEGSLARIQAMAARLHLWQRSTGDTLIPFEAEAWRKKRAEVLKA